MNYLHARNFLLWLLAFAIPVQGFAIAQMTCACSHPTPAMHVVGGPVLTMGEHAYAGHAMQMLAQVDADMDDQATTHPHRVSCRSCSSCSVCVIEASPPLTPDDGMTLPLTPVVHIASGLHGYVGYLPENPERPPSTLL